MSLIWFLAVYYYRGHLKTIQEKKMKSGIYKIENVIDGKKYVGSSKNLNKRKATHWRSLRNNKHHNQHLQRAFNLYGEDSFRFVEIKIVDNPTPSLLFIYESWYIRILSPEYNLGGIGGGDCISNLPEDKKLAFKSLQKTLSLERELQLSESYKENRRKKFEGNKNPNWKGGPSKCPICDSTIIAKNAKTCISCKDISKDKNPFWGKKHDPEFISKMSQERKQLFESKTFEEKAEFYSKRPIQKCTRIGRDYFFSLQEALKKLNLQITQAALQFRCLSEKEKWKDYEIINDQESIIDLIRETYIRYT
jgi:group I intron endonuclease